MKLPPGFAQATHPGRRTAWNERYAQDVEAAGWAGPRGFEALLAGRAGGSGRGDIVEHPLAATGETALVRRVLHGGLFGPLLAGRLRSPERAFAELRANAALRAAGAPVPRPLLAAARRSGPVWNALVATVREERAPDVLAWLATEPEPADIGQAVEAAARAIRRFHDVGGRHADLHVKNLLLRERPDGFDARIVDLDGATHGAPPDAARRMAELARLYRSALKRGVDARLGPEGHRRFLAAYVDGDHTLGAALARHWPRERRRVAWHALGYRGSGSA